MRQLDESAVPACVYVEKRGKQSTEITRRSIDTPNSPWPQSGLHSADLTGEILKMKLPQMPGQFGILVNRPALSRRPFALATFSVRATKPSDASSCICDGAGGEREVVSLERLVRWEASASRAPAHASARRTSSRKSAYLAFFLFAAVFRAGLRTAAASPSCKHRGTVLCNRPVTRASFRMPCPVVPQDI